MDVKYVSALALLLLVSCGAKGQNEVQLQDHKPLLGEIHYGNRVGGIHAQEGETIQLIAFEEGDNIKAIQVFLSERQIVTGFTLDVVKDQDVKTFSFGNIEGIPQEKYHVSGSKKLVGIKGASGWFIDSLLFVFDDGATTPKYGGNGGDLKFSLVLNQKPTGEYLGRLMGFWGSHTNLLETIGLVFWPVE